MAFAWRKKLLRSISKKKQFQRTGLDTVVEAINEMFSIKTQKLQHIHRNHSQATMIRDFQELQLFNMNVVNIGALALAIEGSSDSVTFCCVVAALLALGY